VDARDHRLTLRDGSEAVVRPIRADDKEALLAGFERLSDESRYRRFLTPMQTLSPSMLRYLTEVDHHDHEALVAFEPDSRTAIGVARFVRTGDQEAEAAVTVVDDWQGRGLGTALTSMLAERALDEGIDMFVALMLAGNQDMRDLFESVGEVRTTAHDGGAVQVEVPLHPHAPGAGRGLYNVLRSAASRAVELARPPWRDSED
jgi:GNAT superfamily N-acetyltransferase